MKNYYDILEIAPTASEDEIKAAYRRLARSCHPDVAGEERRARFDEITEAYKLLTDRISRLAYDVNLRYESAYADESAPAYSGVTENRSTAVSVRRKKVKSAASTLFAAFADSAKNTDTVEPNPRENITAESEKPAKKKPDDKPAKKKAEAKNKKPAKDKKTVEVSERETRESVPAKKAKAEKKSVSEQSGADSAAKEKVKPAAREKTESPKRKRNAPEKNEGESVAEGAEKLSVAAEAVSKSAPHRKDKAKNPDAAKRKPAAGDGEQKRMTPSARLKRAAGYIEVLEKQLEKYEELIHTLTRCSVTPLRPELTPSSLNLLLNVNRQARESKNPNK